MATPDCKAPHPWQHPCVHVFSILATRARQRFTPYRKLPQDSSSHPMGQEEAPMR